MPSGKSTVTNHMAVPSEPLDRNRIPLKSSLPVIESNIHVSAREASVKTTLLPGDGGRTARPSGFDFTQDKGKCWLGYWMREGKMVRGVET